MSLLPNTYKISSIIIYSVLIPNVGEIIGDHQCGFQRKNQLLIRCCPFVRHWRKSGSIMRQ